MGCVCVLGFYLWELLEAELEGIWRGGGVGPGAVWTPQAHAGGCCVDVL